MQRITSWVGPWVLRCIQWPLYNYPSLLANCFRVLNIRKLSIYAWEMAQPGVVKSWKLMGRKLSCRFTFYPLILSKPISLSCQAGLPFLNLCIFNYLLNTTVVPSYWIFFHGLMYIWPFLFIWTDVFFLQDYYWLFLSFLFINLLLKSSKCSLRPSISMCSTSRQKKNCSLNNMLLLKDSESRNFPLVDLPKAPLLFNILSFSLRWSYQKYAVLINVHYLQ